MFGYSCLGNKTERFWLQAVMDNGILRLTLSIPGGTVVGIRYNGIDNLLELNNPVLNGG